MHYIENKSSVSSLEMWLEVKEYPKLCNVLNYLLLLASIIVVSYFFFISAASTLYFFFPTCIRFLSFFFFFLFNCIKYDIYHGVEYSREGPWMRAWQPTPLFLSWESHGHRSLAGYSLWGCKELNSTEVT